jgi:hypothetical protein
MWIPGMDGPVNDLEVWDPDAVGGQDELLVIGGAFEAGGRWPCKNLAVWDGQELRELVGGLTDEVAVVKVFGGELWLVTRDSSVYSVTRARVWRLVNGALVQVGGELMHVYSSQVGSAFIGLMETDGLPTLISNFATMDGDSVRHALDRHLAVLDEPVPFGSRLLRGRGRRRHDPVLRVVGC